MSDQSTKDSLSSEARALFKTIDTKLKELIHYGSSQPSNVTNLKLWFSYVNNRLQLKFKTNDTPTYIDVAKPAVIPSVSNLRFITRNDYGDASSVKPVYCIRLEAPLPVSSNLALLLPTSFTAEWNNASFQSIDESLSYFENTVTGNKITFSSMFHKGMTEASIVTDGVRLSFDGVNDLSDWKAYVYLKYEV